MRKVRFPDRQNIATEMKTGRKRVSYGIVTEMKSLVVRRSVTGFDLFPCRLLLFL